MVNFTRRRFISLLGAGTAGGLAAGPALANTKKQLFAQADLRGSMDVSRLGAEPDSHDDQSRILQKILDRAATEGKPVFLPAGNYVASNLNLPAQTRLMGVPGSSRLVYGGHGQFLNAHGCDHVEFNGLVIDGANHKLDNPDNGLLHVRACPHFVMRDCDVLGSAGTGLRLEVAGGRIEKSRISGAAGTAAIHSINATGLAITDNEVSDCANGGILIHRWEPGEDGTIVSGNRIRRIAARDGGTGQRGNGINIFRAHSVIVSNNHVSDCAFSAIRSNGGTNAQITGNTCLRSGETAIYSEFEFEGAVIANNIVDGATIGVSIANFQQGGRMAVCANNLIRNLTTEGPYPAEFAGFGIGIAVEADTAVTGNVVEGAPKYGILLGWGPYLRDVVVSNNVVRMAGEGIAVSVVEGAGQVSITDNVISGATRGAIVGHEWARPVTGDLSRISGEKFAHLQIEGNRVS